MAANESSPQSQDDSKGSEPLSSTPGQKFSLKGSPRGKLAALLGGCGCLSLVGIVGLALVLILVFTLAGRPAVQPAAPRNPGHEAGKASSGRRGGPGNSVGRIPNHLADPGRQRGPSLCIGLGQRQMGLLCGLSPRRRHSPVCPRSTLLEALLPEFVIWGAASSSVKIGIYFLSKSRS